MLILSPLLAYWLVKNDKTREKFLNFTAFVVNSYWIVNMLKGILQVPLPKYPDTFAFPSGHVYMTVTIIAALLFEIMPRKYTYLTIFLISLAEGFRVVHGGYHSTIDVIGTIPICFAQIVIFYELMPKTVKFKVCTLVTGILMCISTVVIMKYHAPSFTIGGLYLVAKVGVILLLLYFIVDFIAKKKRAN